MNNRIWTIVLALGLIACFFLPSISNMSGYDVVFKSPGGKESWDKYVWLLIPVSALILLIGALNYGNYFLGRGIWAWLPLLAIIFIIVRIIMGINTGFDLKVLKELARGFQVGFWASLGISVLLAFVNPRR